VHAGERCHAIVDVVAPALNRCDLLTVLRL
jgi:hypothetical protein